MGLNNAIHRNDQKFQDKFTNIYSYVNRYNEMEDGDECRKKEGKAIL